MGQRFSPSITGFPAGEIGPLTYGRSDLQNYNLSLRKCDNWIPVLQGPLQKRKGTAHIDSTFTNRTARLIPYTLDTAHFMVELPSAPDTTPRPITVRDENGVIVATTTSTFAFEASEIDQIQFAQVEDLLILVHPNYMPHVFVFDGATATLVEQVFNFGPLQTENFQQQDTLKLTGVSGSVEMTFLQNGVHEPGFTFDTKNNSDLIALRTIPQSLHDQWITETMYEIDDYVWSNSYESDRVNVYKAVTAGTSGTRTPGHDSGEELDGADGVLWQMVHSQYGFVRITGFTGGGGTPEVTYQVDVVGFPEIPTDYVDLTNGSFRWSKGLWSSGSFPGRGPASVTFHEQRAVYGGAEGFNFINGSFIDQFTNFLPGSVLDNATFQYSINSSDHNRIRFLISARSLFIGTDNGLFSARASSQGAITATDIIIERSSNRGCAQQQPFQIGEAVLFVQKGGVAMREALFNNDIRGFTTNDLSLLAHHFGERGFNRIAYQSEPESILWTHDNDGVLIGMTYERENEIVAWHQHNLGGSETGTAVVEEVAVLADANNINERLWLIVRRVINGTTMRYIEIVDTTGWSDSHVRYDGVPTSVITGLTHLEGETVTVIGDGAVLPNEVVTAGQIILATEVETALVGLPYVAKAQTQKLEGGGNTGTSQGKSKRIHNVVLRLRDAGSGLLIGEDENAVHLDRVVFRQTIDPMDNPPPLFTGDTDIVPLDQNYESGGMIYLEHNLPNDCTIIALWPNMEVEDAR